MTLIVGVNLGIPNLGVLSLIVADGRYIAPETGQIIEGQKILRVAENLCVCPAGVQMAMLDPTGIYQTQAEANPSVQALLRKGPASHPPGEILRMAKEAVEEGWAAIRGDLQGRGLLDRGLKTALLVGGWHSRPGGIQSFLIAAQKNGDDPAEVLLMDEPGKSLMVGQDDPGTLNGVVSGGVRSAPPWMGGPTPNPAEGHLLRCLGGWVDTFAQQTIKVGGPKSACVIRPGQPIYVGNLNPAP